MYVTKIKYILIYIHLERHQPYIYSNMALYGFKCVQGVSNLIHDGNEDFRGRSAEEMGGLFMFRFTTRAFLPLSPPSTSAYSGRFTMKHLVSHFSNVCF